MDTKNIMHPVVDLFRPEDAPGIVRCYREVYGDNFPISYVYDAARIVEQNRGEDHYTVVGRLPDGDIAGLCALFRTAPNPGVYEAGQLMVRKPFRRTSLAGNLVDELFDVLVSRLGINIVYTESLCNHVISQKMMLKKQGIPTGLEMECLSGINFDEQGDLERNISLMLQFRIYQDHFHTIYPHHLYADFVDGRGAALGLARNREAASGEGRGQTDSDLSIIAGAELARMVVRKAGADWPGVLDRAEAEADNFLFQVQLSLGDPASPWAVEELQRRGFFLAGYLPLWFGEDGIMLQRLPEGPDFTVVQVHGDEARAVMDAVRIDYQRMQRLGR